MKMLNSLFCKVHAVTIQQYYNHDLRCMSDAAAECIPVNSFRRPRVAGWNAYVRPYRENAMFWHAIWKSSGSPRHGVLADIRRSTRARYHNAFRRVKRLSHDIVAVKFAESYYGTDDNKFWSNVKRMKGGAPPIPSRMDDVTGEDDILGVFETKYKALYNSVPFVQSDMDTLLLETANEVASHDEGCAQCKHSITPADVASAVKRLKPNRIDGMDQCLSNHLLHGSEFLYECLARLFNSLVLHGVAPDELLMSTLVPIPKDRRKSLSSSSNYRAIALSSIMGKVLDHVLLAKCDDTFSTSPWQFGFKKK